MSQKPLPAKEGSIFKKVVRCYEEKLYKIGLKHCKQILNIPAFSEHAETLAMKGLILNALGRKEEAHEYVRKGLRNNLKSHTCWHVYGLLQRSERKYDEAVKCYRNALKWDPNNIQIMRELSVVQVHIRDLRGYRDTRYQLFNIKPNHRASWIAFAMSYHLLKDYDMAFNIIQNYRKTQPATNEYDYENSEFLLYQNSIMEESGDFLSALNHLVENSNQICDKVSLRETKGRLCMKMEDYLQAVKIFEELIKINQDNSSYYKQLEKALQIENNTSEKLLLYKIYAEKYPRAILPKRLPLDCTQGEEFLYYLKSYITSAFTKGIPPIFTDLRPLYQDKEKIAAIENLMESMIVCLKSKSRFSEEDAYEDRAPASALLWAYYYMAQHFDYLGDTKTALKCINEAIEHTPTLLELYMCKGKIYKHAGDLKEAVKWMDKGRLMDTADRYINSKSAKYHLRCNLVKEAVKMSGEFTKEGDDVMENLNEMQCMWFQTECALAYQRSSQWGEALKKCHEVNIHFNDIVDDQFDFHSYCLRKMTLRSYMELLRMENVVRAHPFYFVAAKCAIEVYLHLYDNPVQNKPTDEQQSEHLSPAELKKLKNKQRKATKKAESDKEKAAAAAEKKEQLTKAKQNSSGDAEYLPSEQLVPEKLTSTPNPLSGAVEFLIPLQLHQPNCIETHLLAYEIYSRKEKPLLMLQSIKRAYNIDPNHPKLHIFLIKFHQKMSSNVSSLQSPLPVFMKQEMEKIYQGKSIEELNEEFLIENSNSLPCTLAGCQMLYFLKPEEQNSAIQLVTALSEDMQDVAIETCGEILCALNDGTLGQIPSDVVTDFQAKCRKRFSYATMFSENIEIEALNMEN